MSDMTANSNDAQSHPGNLAESSNPLAKDPVCGMSIDPDLTAHHAAHDGQDYHFCSVGCRTKFVAESQKYLADAPNAVSQAASSAIWTCPMHAQIRRPGPGNCPICGMALEPEAPSDRKSVV